MQLGVFSRIGVTPHRKIGPLAQKPFHACEKFLMAVEFARINNFRGVHRDEADQRAYAEFVELAAGKTQHVIEEAFALIPQRVAPPAHVLHR